MDSMITILSTGQERIYVKYDYHIFNNLCVIMLVIYVNISHAQQICICNSRTKPSLGLLKVHPVLLIDTSAKSSVHPTESRKRSRSAKSRKRTRGKERPFSKKAETRHWSLTSLCLRKREIFSKLKL